MEKSTLSFLHKFCISQYRFHKLHLWLSRALKLDDELSSGDSSETKSFFTYIEEVAHI